MVHQLNDVIGKIGSVVDPYLSKIPLPFKVEDSNSQPQQSVAPTPILDVGQETFRGKTLPTAATVPFRGNELDIPGYINFKAFGPDNTQVAQERQAAMQSIATDTPQIGLPAKQPISSTVYDTVRESLSPFLGPTPLQVARDSVQLADGSFAYKPAGGYGG